MSRTDLLTLAAATFGRARLVTEATSLGIRTPIPSTVLEVRGHRDGAWRPLGTVAYDQSVDLIVRPHPKALNEDLRRAASLLNA